MSNDNVTIAKIEELEGFSPRNGTNEEDGLTMWYNKIRQKRLIDLTDGDIAKAIRQEIFLTYTVSEAIKRLRVNPAIGALYDGEVMNALSAVRVEFWISNPLRFEVKSLIESIRSGNLFSDDYQWTFEDDEQNFYKDLSKLEVQLK